MSVWKEIGVPDFTWEWELMEAVDVDTVASRGNGDTRPRDAFSGSLFGTRWLAYPLQMAYPSDVCFTKRKHEQHSHTKKKLPLHLSQLAGSSFKGTLSSLFPKKGIAKVIRLVTTNTSSSQLLLWHLGF